MSTAWGTIAYDRRLDAGAADCDVLVVGLGGSGLAAVHRALDHGLGVIGVDQGSIAGQAAGANGGFLLAGLARFYHETCHRWGRSLARQTYLDTIEQAQSMYRQYPQACRNSGSLRIEDEPDAVEDHYGHLRRDGFPVERYSGPEGHGLRIPTDGVFDPVRVARYDTARAVARGAQLFTQTRMTQVDSGGGYTADGVRLTARRGVIVAVDGSVTHWATRTNVQATRLHMVATAPMAHHVTSHAVYTRGGLDYYQQLPDGRVLLGGGRDQGEDAQARGAHSPAKAVNAYLDQLVERVAPGARITHRWDAPVGFTADGSLVIEQLDERAWLLGGYSGTGNLVGRVTAQACVDAMTGSTAQFNVWRQVGDSDRAPSGRAASASRSRIHSPSR